MSDPALEMRERFEGVLAGAAYGDALGWPNESRGGNKSRRTSAAISRLSSWTRRAGGQFQAFEQTIHAGTYSDDTQLTIAVIRARLKAQDWWQFLAAVELPFWTAYQQGAGGASMRAARLLLKGSLPWRASEDDRARYFQAGGNGVAMRVAGHCLVHWNSVRFDEVKKDVLTDGILTHGHPRALVGALVFAYALWTALRLRGTLEYGELLDRVLASVVEWAALPSIEERWPGWMAATPPGYLERWSITVDEQLQLLKRAQDGLRTGALAFDDEVLRDIGCFSKEASGAGTVAAAAAIYLASRHAAQPEEAVASAALTRGIDTDTIASMIGSITGAVNGVGWLHASDDVLQDRSLFRLLANVIFDTPPESVGDSEQGPVSARSIRDAFSELASGASSVTLPNGQRAAVAGREDVRSRSNRFEYETWRLVDEWSQTLWLRRQRRVDTDQEVNHAPSAGLATSRLAGFSLFTSDLASIRSFYGDVLGLKVSRATRGTAQVGDYLAFRENPDAVVAGTGSIIYVDVQDISLCWQRAMTRASDTVSSVEDRGGRFRFICSDPDGRRIEVFQNKTDQQRLL